MQTDDDLTALFDRAVADLAPDVSAMVRRAEQLGRRLRRRSRICRAGGTALAIAAVAGMGATTWFTHPFSGLGRYADAAGSSATGGPASHLNGKPGPHATGQHPAARKQAASKPMTPRQMLRTLRSMLPAGAVLTKDPTASNGPGSLEVNYNDGHGMADIMIDITPFDRVATSQQMWHPNASGPPVDRTKPSAGADQSKAPAGATSPAAQPSDKPSGSAADGSQLQPVLALSCPHPLWTDEGTRPAGALPISCVIRTPPGGGIERDAVMYADAYGFYGYNIYDQRPDGIEVFIQVGNGYFDPYLPHADRAVPPGSMSLWESVVESPAWH
ncbi:MAG TPA: hypothetical protein VNW50_21645 [Streptosporangiaceae bacterium]|jgi:hypothetical protein|nr:hypothetical protein [Streptosporangiaceae bacterium]